MRSIEMGARSGSVAYLKGGMSRMVWIPAAVVYTAISGLNYRRYKKGYITKVEFWKRMRVGAVSTVGGIAGGTSGAAAGFAVGTAVSPGFGSILGAIVGGTAGGMIGEKIT